MNIRRSAATAAAIAAVILACAGPSSAQINPADMRSGSQRVMTGTAPFTFFTVPAGQVFVLTDLEWSSVAVAGDASPISLNLYGNATERWRMRGAYQLSASSSYLPPLVQSRFSTGLVFGSGEALSFESSSQLVGRTYSLNWSGYLAPAGVSAIGEVGLTRPRTMQQNAPNPFNPQTRIAYRLGVAGAAQLRVFDVSGRLVRTLVNEQQAAGEHDVVWDGSDDSGGELASGVYFYELRTDGGRESRKALLLK